MSEYSHLDYQAIADEMRENVAPPSGGQLLSEYYESDFIYSVAAAIERVGKRKAEES